MKRSRSLQLLAFVCSAELILPHAVAKPTLKVKGAKSIRNEKVCTGANHQNNCTWTADDLKTTFDYGTEIPDKLVRSAVHNTIAGAEATPKVDIPDGTTGMPAANGSFEVGFTWNAACEALDLPSHFVIVSNKPANDPNRFKRGERDQDGVLFTLKCNKPQPKPKAGGGGYYYVPPSQEPSFVPVQFGLLNLDVDASHNILLGTSSIQGWMVSPPLPAGVNLSPGEFKSFETTVTVPAKTPVGQQERLTLTSLFEDDLSAQSSDSVFVVVSEIGACCGPDELCDELSPASCAGLGWIFHGDGTTCDRVSCLPAVPAMSQVGIMLLAVFTLVGIALTFGRRRAVRA